MLLYALKRTAYSILIMAGVLLMTFALFRLAAGDPAATVLGKNPSPAEVEAMRGELGTDKPLIWGSWRRTELYSSADFSNERVSFPGVGFSGESKGTADGAELKRGSAITFSRNLVYDSSLRFRILVKTESPLKIAGQTYYPNAGVIDITLKSPPEKLEMFPEGDSCIIRSVEFFRPTGHLFDSQALASLKEIISFTSEFPYVSVLNFGKTLQTREPIRGKLLRGIVPSLMLMVPIFFGELIIGIVLAMIACAFRGSWVDKAILILSVAGMSISYLALIIFGQWFLAYYLNLFPVWGWGSLKYLWLPVIIGIVSGTGSGVRFYRTVFLNEMNREYLRTAVAKGCSPLKVYFRHLLKNAMIPILTRASTVLPFLFTGSLLLESFFGIPGLGYEGINALNDADLQMLKALVILSAFLFVTINLLSDLAYAWFDPRVKVNK